MFATLLHNALTGDFKSLSRCISLIENEAAGYADIMATLPASDTPVTGITGPPGAGKSTLTDRLIQLLTADGKKVAVICVDPSSPFHMGALLGDRIRMSRWYDNPLVFIRSLAGGNAAGGLSPKIIEITDLLKASVFDHIIIETIGVGQNEIEICGLADTTVVVLVPEGGDEVQTMKAGLMEIADIFVVNKADRAGADIFVKHLKSMLAPAFSAKHEEVPVIKTVASKDEGTAELFVAITKLLQTKKISDNKISLYARKAYALIVKERMKDIRVAELKDEIGKLITEDQFNLYRFLKKYR